MQTSSLIDFDSKYRERIAGVDEAGRGPWAGPVVAAAVIIDCSVADNLYEVNDSKKISEKKRERLFEKIIFCSSAYSISEVSHTVIDRENILRATYLAMANSILKLDPKPGRVLVDGVSGPELEGYVIETLKDGDARSLSIAAASILAKVHRDRIMRHYDRLYPGYGFAKNKGYGTAEHQEALRKKGACPIHRKTYKPVRILTGGK